MKNIKKAIFGTKNKFYVVDIPLKEKLLNKEDIEINNKIFGDPIPGIPKELVITFDDDTHITFKEYDIIKSNNIINDNYKFFEGLDYPGYDLKNVGILSINQLIDLSNQESASIGFNTLGFLKSHIDINNLVPLPSQSNVTKDYKSGLYVNMNKYIPNNLHILADEYSLDKSITYGHNYIPTYQHFFNTRKNTTKKLLEIGIGCVEEGQMTHMISHNYKTGNSLRMWRDFFTHAIICGIDIYEKAMVEEDRIITMVADQSNEKSLLNVIHNFGSDIDIIIDDGSHQIEHQIFTFMFLEKYLHKQGIYIIEDIDSKYVSQFKDLSLFPEDFQLYLKDNYNITCVDSRGIHNNYNDIMCVFERKYPIIYINGISGLTNNLFQILSVVPYAEKNNAKIFLNKSSEMLHYGTSNKFGRDVRRTINGVKQSYLNTLLNKFDTVLNTEDKTHTLANDCFTVNKIDLTDTDIKLLIEGYSQNIELFYEYREKIFDYLNLSDPIIINEIQNKYPMDPHKINIMVGIRMGDDFKHMTKITQQSYTNSLEKILGENSNYHIYVLSDVATEWKSMINNKYLPHVTYVNEDDIVQIYVGMSCNTFICSESTYHYIISLFAYLKDENKKVIIFNDTDLTNRKLTHLFKDWICTDY